MISVSLEYSSNPSIRIKSACRFGKTKFCSEDATFNTRVAEVCLKTAVSQCLQKKSLQLIIWQAFLYCGLFPRLLQESLVSVLSSINSPVPKLTGSSHHSWPALSFLRPPYRIEQRERQCLRRLEPLLLDTFCRVLSLAQNLGVLATTTGW